MILYTKYKKLVSVFFLFLYLFLFTAGIVHFHGYSAFRADTVSSDMNAFTSDPFSDGHSTCLLSQINNTLFNPNFFNACTDCYLDKSDQKIFIQNFQVTTNTLRFPASLRAPPTPEII